MEVEIVDDEEKHVSVALNVEDRDAKARGLVW